MMKNYVIKVIEGNIKIIVIFFEVEIYIKDNL